MATNYTKTDNFSLNLYGDNDPADLRDGYNGSMRTIDDTLEKHLNRIETLEATDTHDAEVLKALGADSVDNATTAKAKWDQAATDATTAITDATTNNGLLAALGADTTDHATAVKTKWDQAASDATTAKTNATTNNGLLAALGADTIDHATAAKTKWDQASDVAASVRTDFDNAQKLANYLVVLGDSWVDGYYAQTKHVGEGPDTAIRTTINPKTFYAKGTSGGGFSVAGDDGTFADIWETVPNKSSVTGVIIIGGQNDATGIDSSTTTEANVMSKARDLLTKIHTDSPNAVIHMIPMVLAVGTTLSKSTANGVNAPARLRVYKTLTTNLKDDGRDYVRVHEGAYRIGVIAAQASDGGNDGDGAHLNKTGYNLVGKWIANCCMANRDLWPTMYATPNNSQISGTWKYTNIYERQGFLHVNFSVNFNAKINSGARVFELPIYETIGNSYFFPNIGNNAFYALDGKTITLQNAMSDTSGTLTGNFTIPAGM